MAKLTPANGLAVQSEIAPARDADLAAARADVAQFQAAFTAAPQAAPAPSQPDPDQLDNVPAFSPAPR